VRARARNAHHRSRSRKAPSSPASTHGAVATQKRSKLFIRPRGCWAACAKRPARLSAPPACHRAARSRLRQLEEESSSRRWSSHPDHPSSIRVGRSDVVDGHDRCPWAARRRAAGAQRRFPRSFPARTHAYPCLRARARGGAQRPLHAPPPWI
jgi:hypothetical protein